jgi:O-antigen ligase
MTSIEYNYNDKTYTDKPLTLVLIMVCFYIFLVIERPWESIRYFHEIPIERVYAILLIGVSLVTNKFKIVASTTNKWVYGILAIHFILAPYAYVPSDAVEQGIEYAKMVVLYLLMLSVIDDERTLKIVVRTYVVSTILYVLHSFWEYRNGRYLWRMGITRMVGADSAFNDPNSFGATIVLSLPIVYALLRTEESDYLRKLYYLYFLLAVNCVVLTGSRSSFAALMALIVIWILVQQGKRKLLLSAAAIVSIAIIWNIMPIEKQDRFRTLWDEEAGPENAKESADSRVYSFKASLRMFEKNPLTGVGAGGKNYVGYRMTNPVDEGPPLPSQAHNLYGEVLAEFGIFGALLLLGLIISIWRSCRWARSQLVCSEANCTFAYHLSGAILVTLLLLLIFGISGHNFYRPLWLWLAAWSGSLIAISKAMSSKEYKKDITHV